MLRDSRDTIAWLLEPQPGAEYRLYYSAEGGMTLTPTGAAGLARPTQSVSQPTPAPQAPGAPPRTSPQVPTAAST